MGPVTSVSHSTAHSWRAARAPRLAAILLGLSLAVAVADSVYRIPVQVSDSVSEIVAANDAPSAASLFTAGLSASSRTLRPLRRVETRWLLQLKDVTGVSYHAVFRGFHALLAVAIVLLFLGAVPVHGWVDVAALGAALTILVGHHTFSGMLREAYPVNHYAVVTAGCLGVAVLARRPPHWITDVAIAAVLAYAVLLVESGVLVWVAVVAAAAVALPGVRRSTVLSATAVVVGYGITRLAFGITAPGVGEHGSGYLDRFYEAGELVERFGDAPLAFMIYNVVSAFASVLWSEPHYGVYATLVGWRQGAANPVVFINIASSALVTALIAWLAWCRRGQPRRDWTEGDRLLFLALAMVVANCLLVTSYIKDEIISVAGVFYAAAAYLALRALLGSASTRRAATTAVLAVLLASGGALWAFRALGLHYQLRATAFTTRNDWVGVVPAEAAQGQGPASGSRVPSSLDLVRRVRTEVILRPGASARFLPRWGDRYWVD